MKKVRLFIVAAILIINVFNIQPAFAVADPNSVSIVPNDIYVNRHLSETNDMLIYAKYYIAYTTTPDEPISDTFLFSLIDTDNTTILGNIIPYPYSTNGYGYGVISFYFSAADAPTWGQNYFLRISESPAEFPSPQSWNFIIPTSAYTSQTTQSGNQDELKSNLLSLANDLEIAWNTTLLTQGDVGEVLNSAGSAYFRNAIYGLQAMCPEIFAVVIADVDYTERTWSTTQATTYEDRFDGTWVGNSFTALSDMFGGVDEQLGTSMLILFLCLITVIGSFWAFGSSLPGMAISAMILPTGMVLGMFAFGMMAIVVICCALYIGYWWFFARS